MSPKPTLSVAFSESDRTWSVLHGRAKLMNFELEPQFLSVEDIFAKQIVEPVFDVAELSLSSYLIALNQGEKRLTAIPAFLSRAFRHNAIYVRSDSPYVHPSELKGCRFGFPEYQMTAAVWVRALFRHEWGIPNDAMEWITFRPERLPIHSPAKRSETPDMFEALVNGEVEAVMSARRPPERYFPRSGEGGTIRRLFPDVWQLERDYYRRTGIFPIMHLVSVKAETAEKYPSLPGDFYGLLLEQKDEAIDRMLETVKAEVANPWLWESIENAIGTMEDPWPYGVRSNWDQIELFMSYLQEDGLLDRKLAPEQVFHASVLTS